MDRFVSVNAEEKMKVYKSVDELMSDYSGKTYFLQINKEECEVVLEALKLFEGLSAKYKPKTKDLSESIKEVRNALTSNNGVEASIISQPNENCVGDVCEV
jgi:uncharacterized protein YfbU (UPF0304 family)|tara:strand:- start:954 stop:1256 length:303 start_codon:yes stop_codon:yes gene_type:complete